MKLGLFFWDYEIQDPGYSRQIIKVLLKSKTSEDIVFGPFQDDHVIDAIGIFLEGFENPIIHQTRRLGLGRVIKINTGNTLLFAQGWEIQII